MSYVTKQFTKFQTVGIAIKLSETFKFQKVTAQSITKKAYTAKGNADGQTY